MVERGQREGERGQGVEITEGGERGQRKVERGQEVERERDGEKESEYKSCCVISMQIFACSFAHHL